MDGVRVEANFEKELIADFAATEESVDIPYLLLVMIVLLNSFFEDFCHCVSHIFRNGFARQVGFG